MEIQFIITWSHNMLQFRNKRFCLGGEEVDLLELLVRWKQVQLETWRKQAQHLSKKKLWIGLKKIKEGFFM